MIINMGRPTVRRPLTLLAAGVALAGAVPAALAAQSHHQVVVKRVAVVDNMFTPTKLSIHTGDKVNFVWSSENFNTHNVTLTSGPKGVSRHAFTSIDGTRGIHFERTFVVAGTYRFSCTIHPDMLETVTVTR